MPARRTVSSPDARWRPDGDGPVCGYGFDGKICEKSGPHYCEPRADRPVRFHAELLVHTKGRWARQAFSLEDWQEHDIIRPVFGEVVWSDEWDCYVRRYTVVVVVIARKNGKSELAAGIVLYLLVGDDEEAAEVYGAAKDTKQAGKVADVVNRMRQLSPVLSKRLNFNKNSRRIFDLKTASYYEVITADAVGELGHNPHGFVLDEVLSQPDASLWDALRTAAGARHQPTFLAITTETNQPHSFGADMIDEAERVQEDPSRNPHMFAYVRKLPADEEGIARLRRIFGKHPDLPVSTDPFDERNWKWPNPGLDTFLSRSALRQEAMEAKNEPAKENPFRQYRTNQRVQQESRWLSLELWDRNHGGEVWPSPDWRRPDYKGVTAWAGLDLSAKLDMTSWAVLCEDGTAFVRFWLPEEQVGFLDDHTNGRVSQWAKAGWVTITDGDVIDYETVYEDICADIEHFQIVGGQFDRWSGEPVRQEILNRTGLDLDQSETTYLRMTEPMKELERLLRSEELRHGGNPVLRWHADNVEKISPRGNPDLTRPVKPDRQREGKRIDGIPTLLFAIDAKARKSAGQKKHRVAAF